MKNNFTELTYEETEVRKKELAQIIWNKPFHTGLMKFTKKDLLILINEITTRIGWENKNWNELDIKDVIFEEKCWLIETLDENFFKREDK